MVSKKKSSYIHDLQGDAFGFVVDVVEKIVSNASPLLFLGRYRGRLNEGSPLWLPLILCYLFTCVLIA
jgi:hypothetical protein